jgi:hypothetical protein
MKYLWCVIGCICAFSAFAQQQWTENDHDEHHLYQRMLVKSGGDSLIHPSIRPWLRRDVVKVALPYAIPGYHSSMDNELAQSLLDANNEFITSEYGALLSRYPNRYYVDSTRTFYFPVSPVPSGWHPYRHSKYSLWNTFFTTPAHFYEIDVKDFYLRVNPLIHVGVGQESVESAAIFINQRGISLRGGIGKGLYFQTSLFDSQARFPNYVNDFTAVHGVVPGVAFYKNYSSALFDFTNGRDYLLAYAYVGFNAGKYVGIQLGHTQNFIGDGIRSLLLSDFATPYFALRINTRIWKLHYQNIFAELAADNFQSVSGRDEVIPKKYMAAHYLSFKPNKSVSVGLFEAVIYDQHNRGFELQYLNPVILYRSIEGNIGSPDNVLLGVNARVDVRKTMSIYGQFVLDDLHVRNILNGHLDWWGNKYGHQLGMKYFDMFGIPFLDGTLEWNRVRPFTYTHYDKAESYTHYKQPLAHPVGANFNEWIFSAQYRPTARWLLESSLCFIHTGEDADSVAYGGNINTPNNQRPEDYGYFIGRGIETNIVYWTAGAHFYLTPGVVLDAKLLWRQKRSASAGRELDTRMFQVGVRYNMVRREEMF